MKKFIFSALAAIGLLLSPSCSDENEALSGSGNEALVSFSVNLADGIQTKASDYTISDGKTAKNLFVRVFEDDGNGSVGNEISTLAKNDVQMEDDLTKEVDFALVKGKTYHFLFWAQAYGSNEAASPYSFDGHTVKVSYANATANDEKRDAFYAVKTKTVTGSFQETVTLKRPFAQLNFLTTANDIIAAKNGGLLVEETSITVASAAQTLTPHLSFNPEENPSVSDAKQDVSFGFAKVPFTVSGETVSSQSSLWIKDNAVVDPRTQDATQYFYLATTYFLVNNAADATAQIVLADVNMKVKDAEGDGLNVQSVPVRMNYRTNIYGNLLTSTGTFKVIIDKNFSTSQPPEQNIEIKEREVATAAAVVEAFEEGASKVTLTTELTSSESSVGIIPQTYADQNTDVIELVLEQSVSSDYVFKYKDANQGQTDHFAPAVVHITIPEGSATINESQIQLARSTVYVNGVKVTTMTAETSQNTLVVGAGSEIGTLNVKAGNVRIMKGGKVGTITRADGNEDVKTIVFLEDGGELTTMPTDPKIELQTSISTVDGLKAFAKAVNNGYNYAGQTVVLTADIDLNGVEWTPIGLNADDSKKFQGTFDGQGHTIRNLNVNQGEGYHAAGFFGALNGTAKNFTIDRATISNLSKGSDSDNRTDNGTAVVAGSIYDTGEIEGVTVKNATVNGNRYVGGIAGYTQNATIKNCNVENVAISAKIDQLTGDYDNGDKVGGIAALVQETTTITGCHVKDVSLKAYRGLGGISGQGSGTLTLSGNTITNLKLIIYTTNGYKTADKYEANARPIIGNLAEVGGNTATNVVYQVDSELALRQVLNYNPEKIELLGDIALTDNLSINTDVTIQGGGFTGMPVYVGTTYTVVFKEIAFKNGTNTKGSSIYLSKFKGDVTFDGCTFSLFKWDAIQTTPEDGAKITVINNTFVAPAESRGAERYLHIQVTADSAPDATIRVAGNTFGAVANLRNSAIDIDYIKALNQLTVGKNTFEDDKSAIVLGGSIYICLKGSSAPAVSYGDAYDAFISSTEVTLGN